MTGISGLNGIDMWLEHPTAMEFYEMACRKMLIIRQSGSLKYEGREHVQCTFVEFPLSDDGLKATHTLEALDSSGSI